MSASFEGRLGLVAGGGGLPRQVAEACVEAGRPFFVVRLKGFADPVMSQFPGIDVGLGEFGKAFKALKAEKCHAVCFAGSVNRPDFTKLKPDLRGMVALPALVAAARRGDDAILRQVLWEFEREGFEIEGAHLAVAGMTMSEGPMGKYRPEARHAEDITRALQVARGIGELDIGQGAVVADGLVLAVEAQEGTDAMLRRVSDLPEALRGTVDRRVGVLAKAPKPIQDRRVDLPTIGVSTVRNAAAAGLAGIVGEAGSVLVVDKAEMIAEADALGMFIYGSPPIQEALTPMAEARPLCILLVAAEASGDALGARLAAAIRERLGDEVRFVGVGGAQMAAQGVVSPFDINQLSVLGLIEGLAAYPRVVARVRDTLDLARREKPDVAVLIDSWGFTLRVARGLKAATPDLPVIKYVGPQVWASRPGRAATLAATVDHLLTIHAFDAPLFEAHGLKTTFVGNPVLARVFPRADPAALRHALGAEADAPVLLVAPGSRPSEIARIAGPFGDAVGLLAGWRPDLQVVVPVAQTVADAVRAATTGWAGKVTLIDDPSLKDQAMAGADVALACSGTVTTELAMAGPPVVVGYKIGGLSYAILKRMVLTPWISLVNIAAGRMVMPEFIQDRCTGPKLAEAVEGLLADPAARAAQTAAQQSALAQMGRGGPDPSEAAATVVLSLVKSA